MRIRWAALAVAAILLWAAAGHAQAATTQCADSFQIGQGDTAFSWCLTQNGNVAQLTAGVGLIMDGAEGYALCGGDPAYWDLGLYGDSGNWAAATWQQPKGAGTLPITVTRSSADGHATLTQVFTLGGGGRTVHVKMSLATAGASVNRIYRYAHVGNGQGYGDHGMRSAFVWASGAFGLTAAPVPTANVAAGLLAAGPLADPCSPSGPATPYRGDSVTELVWGVPTYHKSSVTFDYVPIR